MGIVVSSRQASNIFWHGVTRLNAICVLISSLQRPWPLEGRGVRWFSLFHSPASSFLCLPLSFSTFLVVTTCNFFSPFLSLLVLLLFLASLCTSVVSPGVRGGFPPPDAGGVYRFCALVCHPVSRQRQIHGRTDRSTTCSSIRFCPGALRLRCTTCQPAVSLREEKSKWTASEIATNETTGRFHFFLSTSLQSPPSLSLSLGPLSIQTAAVFIWVRNHLSCIWHLDKVDGQRGEMRADDGERQLTVSGDAHYSPLFPLSYLLFIAF